MTSPGTLALPVPEGRFLRGWGSGARGYHLAIDIGAPAGTPVHAAADGLVAYVGNGVRGYGNTVVLVHRNGWVTWYTHHTQNLVVAGQTVARGEVVGTVGDTGYARGAHLHFMLVADGSHCDALPLLRPELEGGQTIQTRWVGERPASIQCAAREDRPHPRQRRRAARMHQSRMHQARMHQARMRSRMR
jgi:murein DD-endopeptidase MepM/ murein hydrolase activator NlpD